MLAVPDEGDELMSFPLFMFYAVVGGVWVVIAAKVIAALIALPGAVRSVRQAVDDLTSRVEGSGAAR